MIPEEISNFFKSKKSIILLVKGNPGVGKTIFSLETLNELSDYKGIYFSTRDSIDSIMLQVPWIKEIIPSNRFISVSSSSLSYARKELTARNSIVLSTLPNFLKSLYIEILNMRKNAEDTNILVIIDSIDALSATLDVSEREIMKQIKNLFSKLNAKAIVTTETSNLTKIEFMADGVVLLEKSEFDGRTLRLIKIEKLRGLRIQNPFYVFTLEGGHFYCFRKKWFFKLSKKVPPHPVIRDVIDVKDGSRAKLSSGLKQLDMITGGFNGGSCILFSYSNKISSFEYGVLAENFVENFLLQNRHVLYITKKAVNPELDFDRFMNLVDEEKVRKYLHIISLFDNSINFPLERTKGITLEEFKAILLENINNFFREGKGILVVFDFNHVLSYFGEPEEISKIITEILTVISKTNSLLIIKMFYKKEFLDLLEELADYSFHIFTIGGHHYVYGIKPYTPIYHLGSAEYQGHPITTLKIIV
ncbi:MAG: ATPase domain-containing protein [Candidatus Asgardarchaeia archaeon]